MFDDGFLTAVRADGTALRFTRQERALLGLFAGQPRRLFARADLMAALESDGSDRNVDFVINRLRRKLDDTGPERRFISTQYGEGYVWIASALAGETEPALLVIGPVRGALGSTGEALLAQLRATLQAGAAPERRVILAPDWRPDPQAATAFRFSLDASFHRLGERLHVALVLREAPTHEVVQSFREVLAAEEPPRDRVSALAAAISDAVWKRLALGSSVAGPTDQPLLLRMQTAAQLLDPPGVTWLTNGEHLGRMRSADPSDPVAAVMWAMHLFARTVLDLGDAPLSAQTLDPIDGEVERLVLGALPSIRGEPVLALAAAKLLLLVHRGHTDLAQELAVTAFGHSAAFAAAFPMLAQIAACRGDLAEADRLYDEGLQLCEAGSEFEVYILFLKAAALMAGDDRAGVEAVFDRLAAIKPSTRDQIGLFFLPPGDTGLARRLASQLDHLSLERARKMIAYQHYRIARFFVGPGHATNVLLGVLSHFVRRFGPGVASDELWAELPADLQYLRGPAGQPVNPP